MIFTVLFIFFWFFLSVKSSQDQANRKENFKNIEVRKMLLENLLRFRSDLSPLLVLQTTNGISINHVLTLELLTESALFLDEDSLLKFNQIGKDALSVSRYTAASRLTKFNPHYVFAKGWFNVLMLKILNLNFPKNLKFNDPKVKDYLELMTFKFVMKENTLKFIPRCTYLAILSFMHETVYGIDAHVPLNAKDWRMSFVRRIQETDLSLTKEYFIEFYSRKSVTNHVSPAFDNIRKWIEALELFATNPNPATQLLFRTNLHSAYNSNRSEVFNGMEFNIVMEENLRIASSVNRLTMIQSQKLFDAFTWNEVLIQDTRKRLLENFYWFNREFYRKFSADHNDPFLYIWSRDSLNPFDVSFLIENYKFDSYNLMFQLINVRMPNLVKMDIVSQIIRSGILKLDELKVKDRNIIKDSILIEGYPIYEIILKESPMPINFAFEKGQYYKSDFFNLPDFEYTRMTIQSLNRQNPLALIVFPVKFLLLGKQFIAGIFDLNTRYNFKNISTNIFNCEILSGFNLKKLQSPITFRTFLKILNIAIFFEIFGITERAENLKDPENLESQPIYSVKRFIEEAIFVPESHVLDENVHTKCICDT